MGAAAGWLRPPAGPPDRRRRHQRRSLARAPRTGAVGAVHRTGVPVPSRAGGCAIIEAYAAEVRPPSSRTGERGRPADGAGSPARSSSFDPEPGPRRGPGDGPATSTSAGDDAAVGLPGARPRSASGPGGDRSGRRPDRPSPGPTGTVAGTEGRAGERGEDEEEVWMG